MMDDIIGSVLPLPLMMVKLLRGTKGYLIVPKMDGVESLVPECPRYFVWS
jgi:hypothetical protein